MMEKISLHEVKSIAKRNGLKACVIKGTRIVTIRKNTRSRAEDISWTEFERILNDKRLAVYRTKDDWLKILRDMDQ